MDDTAFHRMRHSFNVKCYAFGQELLRREYASDFTTLRAMPSSGMVNFLRGVEQLPVEQRWATLEARLRMFHAPLPEELGQPLSGADKAAIEALRNVMSERVVRVGPPVFGWGLISQRELHKLAAQLLHDLTGSPTKRELNDRLVSVTEIGGWLVYHRCAIASGSDIFFNLSITSKRTTLSLVEELNFLKLIGFSAQTNWDWIKKGKEAQFIENFKLMHGTVFQEVPALLSELDPSELLSPMGSARER